MMSEVNLLRYADFRRPLSRRTEQYIIRVAENSQSQKQAMRKLYIIYSYEEY
jgi:hypothetical protein